MTKAQHTKGPWGPEFEESYNVRAPDGGLVAICTNLKGRHATLGRRNNDEVASNTHLIAAAPELLEALERIVANLDEGDFISTTRIDEGKAAIAKARGESQ